MGNKKRKVLLVNKEMETDLAHIAQQYKTKFGKEPSSTNLVEILIANFKREKVQIKRKPKSKNGIIFY